MRHIVFIHMSEAGQCFQRDMLCIVSVQVFFYLGTFFCHSDRRDGHGHHMTGAHDPENQDLKKMLADQIGAVPLGFDFIIHLGEQIGDQHAVVKAAEYLRGGRAVFWLESDSVDTDHIIFEGHTRNRLFRMLQIRRDDNKVSCFNLMNVIAEEEIPFSVHYEENFRKMVRVKYALPVFFIF